MQNQLLTKYRFFELSSLSSLLLFVVVIICCCTASIPGFFVSAQSAPPPNNIMSSQQNYYFSDVISNYDLVFVIQNNVVLANIYINNFVTNGVLFVDKPPSTTTCGAINFYVSNSRFSNGVYLNFSTCPESILNVWNTNCGGDIVLPSNNHQTINFTSVQVNQAQQFVALAPMRPRIRHFKRSSATDQKLVLFHNLSLFYGSLLLPLDTITASPSTPADVIVEQSWFYNASIMVTGFWDHITIANNSFNSDFAALSPSFSYTSVFVFQQLTTRPASASLNFLNTDCFASSQYQAQCYDLLLSSGTTLIENVNARVRIMAFAAMGVMSTAMSINTAGVQLTISNCDISLAYYGNTLLQGPLALSINGSAQTDPSQQMRISLLKSYFAVDMASGSSLPPPTAATSLPSFSTSVVRLADIATGNIILTLDTVTILPYWIVASSWQITSWTISNGLTLSVSLLQFHNINANLVQIVKSFVDARQMFVATTPGNSAMDSGNFKILASAITISDIVVASRFLLAGTIARGTNPSLLNHKIEDRVFRIGASDGTRVGTINQLLFMKNTLNSTGQYSAIFSQAPSQNPVSFPSQFTSVSNFVVEDDVWSASETPNPIVLLTDATASFKMDSSDVENIGTASSSSLIKQFFDIKTKTGNNDGSVQPQNMIFQFSSNFFTVPAPTASMASYFVSVLSPTSQVPSSGSAFNFTCNFVADKNLVSVATIDSVFNLTDPSFVGPLPTTNFAECGDCSQLSSYCWNKAQVSAVATTDYHCYCYCSATSNFSYPYPAESVCNWNSSDLAANYVGVKDNAFSILTSTTTTTTFPATTTTTTTSSTTTTVNSFCNAGQYYDANRQNCTACPGGQYCQGSGLTAPTGPCSAGYYCVGGAASPTPNDGGITGGTCPVDFYCPIASGSPFSCPTGTGTNGQVGATSNADCVVSSGTTTTTTSAATSSSSTTSSPTTSSSPSTPPPTTTTTTTATTTTSGTTNTVSTSTPNSSTSSSTSSTTAASTTTTSTNATTTTTATTTTIRPRPKTKTRPHTHTHSLEKSATQSLHKFVAPVIPIPVSESLTDTALAVSTATGAANMVLVQQLQRNTALLQIARCGKDGAESIGYLSSPTQLSIGTDWRKYHRGTVIGNFVIVAGILLVYSLALPILMLVKGMTFFQAILKARYPSYIFVVAALLGAPTATSGAVLFWYGDGVADVMLMVFLGLFLPFVPLVVLLVLWRQFASFNFPLRPIKVEPKDKKDSCTTKTLWWLYWAVRPTHKWPEKHAFITRYFPIYYPIRTPWFAGFDWFITMSIAILSGLAGNITASTTVCISACAVSIFLLVLHLVVLVFVKPHLARSTRAVQIFLSGFAVVNSILSMTILVGESSGESAMSGVASAQNVVAIVGGVFAAIDVGIDLYELCGQNDDDAGDNKNTNDDGNDNDAKEMNLQPLILQKQDSLKTEPSVAGPLLLMPTFSKIQPDVNDIKDNNNNNNNEKSTSSRLQQIIGEVETKSKDRQSDALARLRKATITAAMAGKFAEAGRNPFGGAPDTTVVKNQNMMGEDFWKNLADDDDMAADITNIANTQNSKSSNFFPGIDDDGDGDDGDGTHLTEEEFWSRINNNNNNNNSTAAVAISEFDVANDGGSLHGATYGKTSKSDIFDVLNQDQRLATRKSDHGTRVAHLDGDDETQNSLRKNRDQLHEQGKVRGAAGGSSGDAEGKRNELSGMLAFGIDHRQYQKEKMQRSSPKQYDDPFENL